MELLPLSSAIHIMVLQDPVHQKSSGSRGSFCCSDYDCQMRMFNERTCRGCWPGQQSTHKSVSGA